MNTAEEAPVAFIITGVGLGLDGISVRLNTEPTHSHRVGEVHILAKPYDHDMWMLNSPLSETEPLDAHLKWFIEKLKPYYEFIQALKENARIYFYCGVNCQSDQCGFTLTSEALSIFTELGISMEVTVLFGSEDE